MENKIKDVNKRELSSWQKSFEKNILWLLNDFDSVLAECPELKSIKSDLEKIKDKSNQICNKYMKDSKVKDAEVELDLELKDKTSKDKIDDVCSKNNCKFFVNNYKEGGHLKAGISGKRDAILNVINDLKKLGFLKQSPDKWVNAFDSVNDAINVEKIKKELPSALKEVKHAYGMVVESARNWVVQVPEDLGYLASECEKAIRQVRTIIDRNRTNDSFKNFKVNGTDVKAKDEFDAIKKVRDMADFALLKSGQRVEAHNSYNNRIKYEDLKNTFNLVMKEAARNPGVVDILKGQLEELKGDYQADINNSKLDKDDTKEHYNKYKKLAEAHKNSQISKEYKNAVDNFISAIK